MSCIIVKKVVNYKWVSTPKINFIYKDNKKWNG